MLKTTAYLLAAALLVCTAASPSPAIEENSTHITVTVGPDGRDFNSIDDANILLVSMCSLTSKVLTDNSKSVVLKLYGKWKETFGGTLEGWTCSADYRIHIVAGEGRPLIYDDSDKTTNKYTLRLDSCNFAHVSGLHLLANSLSSAIYGTNFAIDFGDSDNVTVTDCIIEAHGSSTPNIYNFGCNLDGRFITIDNCTFLGNIVYTRGVFSLMGLRRNCEIKNCTFSGLGRAIYASGGRKLRIHHCLFTDCNPYNIYCSGYTNFRIYNNIIISTGYNNIYLLNPDFNDNSSLIVNNTILTDSISSEGIAFYNIVDQGHMEIRNNIILLNAIDARGLFIRGTNCHSDNNCVYNMSGGVAHFGYDCNSDTRCTTVEEWTTATGMDGHSLWGQDPMILSFDSDNALLLRINEMSVCCGNGVNLLDLGFSFITHDIDGDLRPPTGEWTIGADEPRDFGPVPLPRKPEHMYTSGRINPTDLFEQPVFTVTFEDDNEDEVALAIHIQVSANIPVTLGEMWDTIWLNIDATPHSENCEDINYGGSLLAEDTTYYWRARWANSSVHLSPWSDSHYFRISSFTLPGKTLNPTPAHQSTGIPREQTFSWDEGVRADSYLIYISENADSFQFHELINETSYIPGWLVEGRKYYWRVDNLNDIGTTQGDLWRFKTKSSKGGGCTMTSGFLTWRHMAGLILLLLIFRWAVYVLNRRYDHFPHQPG